MACISVDQRVKTEFSGRGFKSHSGQLFIPTSKNSLVVNTIYNIYQVDEITYAKGGSTLNAYICAEARMWKGSKNWSQDPLVLNGWLQINVMEHFLCIVQVPQSIITSKENVAVSFPRNTSCTIVLSYAIIMISQVPMFLLFRSQKEKSRLDD